VSRRISFTVDDARAAEISAYAQGHGYASAGDFARVAADRIMRMYPYHKAAQGARIAPGVPREPHGEPCEGAEGAPEGAPA
jgi:hypothetical protein